MTGDPDHLPVGSRPGDAAIVLAAGKGTRMRSQLPKVLQVLAGKPMLERVLNTLAGLGFNHPTAVVGYGADVIRERFGERCRYVDQTEQLGTGHAARLAVEALSPEVSRIIVIHGDEPMIEPATYRDMLRLQTETGAPIVLLTTHLQDTHGLGRVVRDGQGAPIALVQEGDLTPEQRLLTEINLGAYVFDAAFLRARWDRLQPHPPKGEYYLTDMVQCAVEDGLSVAAITVPHGEDVLGANDLVQLEAATRVIYRRNAQRHMLNGVTVVDGATTYIDDEVRIEPDTIIHPFTILSGATSIGAHCEIGPGARIIASHIGDHCTVQASTVVDSALGAGVRVGPYAHVRGGATLEAGVELGTSSEVKGSTLGAGTKMHHFGYLGDATIGAQVNIGAGVVTCNFDGARKHRTVVGNNAFIGSDTMLRAPVTVGDGGYTGAGSVVTHDVAPGSLVAGVPARLVREITAQKSEPRDGLPAAGEPETRREA